MWVFTAIDFITRKITNKRCSLGFDDISSITQSFTLILEKFKCFKSWCVEVLKLEALMDCKIRLWSVKNFSSYCAQKFMDSNGRTKCPGSQRWFITKAISIAPAPVFAMTVIQDSVLVMWRQPGVTCRHRCCIIVEQPSFGNLNL